MASQTDRVVLVSEDRSLVQAIEPRLGALGPSISVETHTDPEAALHSIESNDEVSCLVGDTQHPELSGVALLDAVRERDEWLPVVMLTDGEGTPDPGELLEAGAETVLRKPAVRDRAGGLDATVENAVESRRSQQRLEEGFGFLDTVLGALDDIVYVTDTNGQPIYWNQAATRITGYTSAEAQALDMLEFFPEEDHETVLSALEVVLETGSTTFEADLLTKAGVPLRYEFSSTTLHAEDGSVIGICGAARDVSHRHYYENALRALHRCTRDLFAAGSRQAIATTAASATEYVHENPLAVVLLAEDGQLVPTAATDEALARLPALDPVAVDADLPAARSFREGETVSAEGTDVPAPWPEGTDVLYLPLAGAGVLALASDGREPLTGTHRQLAELLAANTGAALARNESERLVEQREEMLKTLHDTTRELILTDDPEAVAAVIVADAEAVLDLAATAVYLWDDQRGRLSPASTSDAAEELLGELSPVAEADGLVWEAFLEAETTVVQNTATSDDALATDAEAGSLLVVPIGDHGVLLSGSSTPGAFTETAVEFAELLATNAATALDRTERERAMVRKDELLEERNEELRRLNRLDAIIRRITEGVVQAASRAEVLDVTCATLADVEHYRFSWVGQPSGDRVTPLAFAGDAEAVLEHVTPTEGGLPVPDEPLVVNDVHRDDRVRAWRTALLRHGIKSLVRLPLGFGEGTGAFLAIHADEPGLFTDEEVEVLSELAALITHAVEAVEREEALLTGREVQLEFAFDDLPDPLARLARQTGGSLSMDGLVPRGADSWLVYATVTGIDAATLSDAVEDSYDVTRMDVLRAGAGDRLLVSLTVSSLSLVDAVGRGNATLRTLRVDPEGGRVSVTVPQSTDVREYVEGCRQRLPELRLVRRQTVSEETPANRLQYDLADLLTEKQLEALQTAYFKGYFEWPRRATGVDVAEALGVSPPTFQQHLRKSLARIFSTTFESGAGPD